MKVIDLPAEQETLYCQCLEDWSDEIKEAGDRKEIWLRRMKERGLRVKLALDEKDVVGGMIHYQPIEASPAEGEGLYFVNCIWVHGHKQGRGNFQKKGMGKALLAAAEEDVRRLGAKGLAVWGLALPFWMRASWFKRNGYAAADREGMQVLLWKPFAADARPPRWIRPKKKPQPEQGKVSVTAFCNGWCPAQNITVERARRAAAELDGRVEFKLVDTFERPVFLEWGISDALFVDGKQVGTGPPPSYEAIRRVIAGRLKKLPKEAP